MAANAIFTWILRSIFYADRLVTFRILAGVVTIVLVIAELLWKLVLGVGAITSMV